MNRALFLIIIGLGGAAILVSLGVWQIQRLAWKQSVIAEIDARIVDSPVALPAKPDPMKDAYLPVEAAGTTAGDTLRVLVSQKEIGAGYRLITAFETGGRRVLLDRGFIPTSAGTQPAPEGPLSVIGNLQWPQETDRWTPLPDLNENIWFARDVPVMAETLQTEPVLLVVREMSPSQPQVTPLPVDTTKIPNDHLQYAITWFSLAAIWLAMTTLFVLRRRTTLPSEST